MIHAGIYLALHSTVTLPTPMAIDVQG